MKIEDLQLVKQIIEGALMASEKPLSKKMIKELFDDLERPEDELFDQALNELEADCEGRGFELQRVASGYRFQVRQELSGWVSKLWKEKAPRYSRALLETLSLIAYRQPITRGEIEDIRGVAVSSHIIKTLLEREWVKVVGHRDVPGRPAIYATTKQFLDYFNLKSLEQLPPLAELRDLNVISKELNMELPLELTDETEGSKSEQKETESEVSADETLPEESSVNEGEGDLGDLEEFQEDADQREALNDEATEAETSNVSAVQEIA